MEKILIMHYMLVSDYGRLIKKGRNETKCTKEESRDQEMSKPTEKDTGSE